jgi:hypothetical protein
MVVASLVESFAVFVSPPPVTLATLVTVAGALVDTSTVNVIGA